MRNCIKKLSWALCLLTVVVAVIFILPTRANAATVDDLTYQIYEGKVTITDCDTSASGELVIPDTIEGCPVTGIDTWAFYSCSSLTSITLPEGVTSIGDYAFHNCSSLTSITLPEGVTSIGDYAFYNCSSLTSITLPEGVTSIGNSSFYNCSSLISISIPESVTSIGDEAFYTCSGLTAVTIFDSVTSIGAYAFCRCTGLKSMTIPDGVTSIGKYAFEDCENIVDLTISNGVLNIEKGAFSGCSSLTNLTIPEGVVSIGDYAFYCCDSLLSVTIPESVVSIGESAFSWCYSLTSVIIPDSVISLGAEAFDYCLSLTDLTIGSSVTSLESGVFSNCGMTNVTIPNSVTSIGELAFRGCDNLLSVTIPGSITTIGELAFFNCGDLASVTIPGSVTSIGDRAFDSCGDLSSLTIMNGVNTIGASAFSDCFMLTSVTIPGSVTSIGTMSFSNCYNLTQIDFIGNAPLFGTNVFNAVTANAYYPAQNETWVEDIMQDYGGTITWMTSEITESEFVASGTCGESLTWVLDAAGTLTISGTGDMIDYDFIAPWYENRDLIINVVIENGVTGIGDGAFLDCGNLTSVMIPESVTSVSNNHTFFECDSLKGIWVEENNDFYSNDSHGVLFDKGQNKLIAAPGGIDGAYVIPDSVSRIDQRAFYSCTGLSHVTILEGVTDIGDDAFGKCTALADIVFKGDAPIFGADLFSNVTATAHFPALNDTWTADVMQNYGGEVTWVSYGVVASGTCGDDLTWILQDSGKLTISGTGAMEDYSYKGTPWYAYVDDIATVVIEEGATSIGVYAFLNCSSLSSITIPDSVSVINSHAFYGCNSLTSVDIPSSVTQIGVSAFRDCASLTGIWVDESNAVYSSDSYGVLFDKEKTVLIVAPNAINGTYTVPDSVLSLENEAFHSCHDLVSIVLGENVVSIGNNMFWKCTSLTSVTFPESVSNINGGNTFYGCTSLTSVTFPESVSNINGGNMFCGCTSLTSVDLPNGMTDVGISMFEDCSNLTAVTIPDSVINIEISAFYNCSSLTSVNISDSVTDIGDFAFAYCNSLTSVTIPDSVLNIGYMVFAECDNLKNIIFKGDCPVIEDDAFIGVTATAYYPNDHTTWTEEVRQSYGGSITWVASSDAEDPVPTEPSPLPTEPEPEATEENVVERWNVVLTDDLKVNFYLQHSFAETATVTVTVGESFKSYNLSDLEKSEDEFYIVSVNVAAAQMCDDIMILINDAGGVTESAKYTVRQYADTILADESFSEYHNMVKEMLNYGAAAQSYFGHETESLANDGITDTGVTDIPTAVETEISVSGKVDGVSFYAASLLYRNKTAVRYYFKVTGDINAYSITSGGKTYTPEMKDGLYYIEISEITPDNLDQRIEISVTDANDSVLTVSYSPMNYIVRMNEKGSDNLKALLKALYNYHLAAKAFCAA